MEFTAQTIADYIKGIIVGDPLAKVNMVAKIEEGTAGTLAFLANPKYEEYIYTTASTIVIVGNNFEPKQDIKAEQ